MHFSELHKTSRLLYNNKSTQCYNIILFHLTLITHLLGLDNGAWESVEQESVLALGLVQVGVNHVHDQVIGYQLAIVHDLLHGRTKARPRLDFRPQHITGGQVAHAVLLLQDGRLSWSKRMGRRNNYCHRK